MRIAWIGSAGAGGGVGGYGRDLLRGLLRLSQDITLFSGEDPNEQHAMLKFDAAHGQLSIEYEQLHWRWGRWYSRNHTSIFFSSLLARTQLHRRIVRRLVAAHRREPFDIVVQFSQFELLSIGRHLCELPPVVLLPCVHAAGELEWHRKESKIARQSERWWVHSAVRLNLFHRSIVQKRDACRVAAVLGMSQRFNELIRRDYGVQSDHQAVIYQPVVKRGTGGGSSVRQRGDSDPIKIVFIGRISVRKGIECMVELSHRLIDLAGKVTLEVVGGPSFWSNYTGELARLNPVIGRYLGTMPHDKILELLADSDVLIVPSKYEPGGIVVAEALAQGCLPVVSEEVGSAEPLDATMCEKFSVNDMNAFEAAVRRAVDRVGAEGMSLRQSLASAAHAVFDLDTQAHALLGALQKYAVVKGVR